jgi:hypothetical protein
MHRRCTDVLGGDTIVVPRMLNDQSPFWSKVRQITGNLLFRFLPSIRSSDDGIQSIGRGRRLYTAARFLVHPSTFD